MAAVVLLLAGLLVFGPAPDPAAASTATVTALSFDGSAGGWVGMGIEETFFSGEPGVTLTVTGNSSRATFFLQSPRWRYPSSVRVELQAVLLAPGTYQDTSTESNGTPSIDVSASNNGCNGQTGSFTVHERSVDVATGELTAFAASFTAVCPNEAPVTGELRFNSSRTIVSREAGGSTLALMATDLVASVDRTARVTSAGTAPLVLGAPTISGADAARFTITGGTCSGATLEPGESCTIGVRYDALDAVPRQATLTVPDNTRRGHRAYSLVGEVAAPSPLSLVPPSGTVAPTSAVFVHGSSPRVWPVEWTKHDGDDGMSFAAEGGPHGVFFGRYPSGSLHTSMDLHFAPAKGDLLAVGLYVGATRWPFHEGAAPGLDANVGATGCDIVATAFRVHQLDFSSDGSLAAFAATVVQTCGSGGYVVVEVRYRSTVPLVARAVVPSSPLSITTVRGTDSEPAPVTVTATGTAPLHVQAASIAGADAASFSIVQDDCTGAVTAPGESCLLAVVFHSEEDDGSRTLQARLVLDDDTAATGREVQIYAYGELPPPPPRPNARLSPTWIAFPTTPVDELSDPEIVVLTNDGPGDLHLYDAWLDGPDPEDFDAYTDCFDVILSAGASCVFEIAFWPSAAGARSATLLVSHDGNEPTQSVSLSGDGAAVAPPPPPPPAPHPAPSPSAPSPQPRAQASVRSGYWMVTSAGEVHAFGDAPWLGNASVGRGKAVDLEGTPSGGGYWIVDDGGHVFSFGNAPWLGGVDGLARGEVATSMSATPSGNGYWIFTSRGRVVPRGDAGFFGDLSSVTLNGPVLDSVPTPTGQGYYLVASDGGVFTFGDAAFSGSMGATRLNAPVQSLVPDGDGLGYWLVASDGGIFAFDAAFLGSMGDVPLNRPVTGMVASRTGLGYLMVAEDGGVFTFGDVDFRGSLGASPPSAPVVAVSTLR